MVDLGGYATDSKEEMYSTSLFPNNNIIELPKYCPSHLSNPIIRFQTTNCICHFGTNKKTQTKRGGKKKGSYNNNY